MCANNYLTLCISKYDDFIIAFVKNYFIKILKIIYYKKENNCLLYSKIVRDLIQRLRLRKNYN